MSNLDDKNDKKDNNNADNNDGNGDGDDEPVIVLRARVLRQHRRIVLEHKRVLHPIVADYLLIFLLVSLCFFVGFLYVFSLAFLCLVIIVILDPRQFLFELGQEGEGLLFTTCLDKVKLGCLLKGSSTKKFSIA